MSAQSFRYEFTVKELVYFLFRKKKCPKCSGQMKKNKCCEIVDGSIFNTDELYIKGRQVKHYFYAFTCQKCGSEYTLTELSK